MLLHYSGSSSEGTSPLFEFVNPAKGRSRGRGAQLSCAYGYVWRSRSSTVYTTRAQMHTHKCLQINIVISLRVLTAIAKCNTWMLTVISGTGVNFGRDVPSRIKWIIFLASPSIQNFDIILAQRGTFPTINCTVFSDNCMLLLIGKGAHGNLQGRENERQKLQFLQ